MKELLEKWKEYQEWCAKTLDPTAKLRRAYNQPTFEGFMEWLERNTK